MKSIFTIIALTAFLAGCSPTVKIEHEIRLRVDKELDGLFDDDSDVF